MSKPSIARYRVRYHLARGDNFMKWQIKDTKTGQVTYIDPDQSDIVLWGCRLKNSVTAATRIYAGASKDVCAWVECDRVIATSKPTLAAGCTRVQFNPRKCIHWRSHTCGSVDGAAYSVVFSVGRALYAHNPNPN